MRLDKGLWGCVEERRTGNILSPRSPFASSPPRCTALRSSLGAHGPPRESSPSWVRRATRLFIANL